MEINEANIYDFEQGSVDSGKVVLGGTDNNWGGSMERTLEIASFARSCSGYRGISSQKRSRVKTASGNVSDHYKGNLSAYAVDIPARGEKGDNLLKCIMSKFNNGSNSSYKGGHWLNVTIDGYRYQFGWRVKNHYRHIHVGVKKTGGAPTKIDYSDEKAEKVLFDANSFGKNGDENLNKLLDELKTKGIENPQDVLKTWIGSVAKKELKFKSFSDILNSDEYKQLLKYLEVSEIEQMHEEIQRIKKIIG